MNLHMQKLFSSVRDGLFIVSTEGHMRYGNPSALRLIPCAAGQKLPNEPLQRLVASVQAGHLTVPHEVQVEIGGDCLEAEADSVRAILLRSPVGDDYVIVLHNLTAEHFFQTGMHNFAQLIERAHSQDLSSLAQRIEEELARLPNLAPGSTLHALMNDARQHLASIEKLVQLAELSGGKPVLGDDRIELTRMVMDTAERVAAVAQKRLMRIIVEKPQQDLPPIYGSETWIGRAVDELFENALKHGDPGTDVTVHLKQNASFLMMTVRNAGHALASTIQNRLFEPGYRGKAALQNQIPGFGLGLPLCKQVVELHGGHLSLGNRNDDSVEFAMELPTGAPHTDPEAMNLAQAQRYAQDLARLMARRRETAKSAN